MGSAGDYAADVVLEVGGDHGVGVTEAAELVVDTDEGGIKGCTGWTSKQMAFDRRHCGRAARVGLLR